MKTQLPPLLYFGYSNESKEFLESIAEEQSAIGEAHGRSDFKNTVEVKQEPSLSLEKLHSTFTDPANQGRIELFHFAGHSNGLELLLRSEDDGIASLSGNGLAEFLALQRSLKLVFLNSCASAGHVEGLLNAGVRTVIATKQTIGDTVAKELSVMFYKGIFNGATINQAFAEAESYVKNKYQQNPRSCYSIEYRNMLEGAEDALDDYPWAVYPSTKLDDETGSWNLPAILGNPLYGLPPLPKQDLPESPFKQVSWFQYEDADVFFGRGDDIRNTYNRILFNSAPILLLYGYTGVGKSSFLEAGLRPRLDWDHDVIYIRRNNQLKLKGTLEKAICKGGTKNIRESWIDREASQQIRNVNKEKSGKGLIVILDQVEECFTDGSGLISGEEELGELSLLLDEIFSSPVKRPKGKLILSFREEWLPSIKNKIDGRLYTENRLETLNRQGIKEVVFGPCSKTEFADKWRLKIQTNLEDEVASSLLSDKHSPIAPTLQIILTKMWEIVKDDTNSEFDIDLFQHITQARKVKDGSKSQLEKQIDDQIAAVTNHKDDRGQYIYRTHVESGLLLDVLHYHTTSLASSQTRTLAEIETRYSHINSPSISELMQICKDKYLLSTPLYELRTKQSQNANLENHADARLKSSVLDYSRLSHDVFAIYIRKLFSESERPGQKASRLIAYKDSETGPKVIFKLHEAKSIDTGRFGMANESYLHRIGYEGYKNMRNGLLAKLLTFVLIVAAVSLYGGYKVKIHTSAENQKKIIGYAVSKRNLDERVLEGADYPMDVKRSLLIHSINFEDKLDSIKYGIDINKKNRAHDLIGCQKDENIRIAGQQEEINYLVILCGQKNLYIIDPNGNIKYKLLEDITIDVVGASNTNNVFVVSKAEVSELNILTGKTMKMCSIPANTNLKSIHYMKDIIYLLTVQGKLSYCHMGSNTPIADNINIINAVVNANDQIYFLARSGTIYTLDVNYKLKPISTLPPSGLVGLINLGLTDTFYLLDDRGVIHRLSDDYSSIKHSFDKISNSAGIVKLFQFNKNAIVLGTTSGKLLIVPVVSGELKVAWKLEIDAFQINSKVEKLHLMGKHRIITVTEGSSVATSWNFDQNESLTVISIDKGIKKLWETHDSSTFIALNSEGQIGLYKLNSYKLENVLNLKGKKIKDVVALDENVAIAIDYQGFLYEFMYNSNKPNLKKLINSKKLVKRLEINKYENDTRVLLINNDESLLSYNYEKNVLQQIYSPPEKDGKKISPIQILNNNALVLFQIGGKLYKWKMNSGPFSNTSPVDSTMYDKDEIYSTSEPTNSGYVYVIGVSGALYRINISTGETEFIDSGYYRFKLKFVIEDEDVLVVTDKNNLLYLVDVGLSKGLQVSNRRTQLNNTKVSRIRKLGHNKIMTKNLKGQVMIYKIDSDIIQSLCRQVVPSRLGGPSAERDYYEGKFQKCANYL